MLVSTPLFKWEWAKCKVFLYIFFVYGFPTLKWLVSRSVRLLIWSRANPYRPDIASLVIVLFLQQDLFLTGNINTYKAAEIFLFFKFLRYHLLYHIYISIRTVRYLPGFLDLVSNWTCLKSLEVTQVIF